MCIYYKDKTGLSYTSREHIIPAGFGGIATLERGIVSDEFNNDISKLEREFLQKSLIGSFREILGPGKRGSLSEKKQTKSKVKVLIDSKNESNISMGYMKKAKPFLIPHLLLNTETKENQVVFNNAGDIDYAAAVMDFKQNLENAQVLRIRYSTDNRLPEDIILIGIEPGIEEHFDAFFIKNEANKTEPRFENLQRIGKGIKVIESEPKSLRNHVVVQQNVIWSEEHYRLVGKMLLNFLAYRKGKDFVMNTCFDGVRNWIAYGGTNTFAEFKAGDVIGGANMGFDWPQDAHVIIVSQEGNKLFGWCTMYNSKMSISVTLSDSFDQRFQPDGLVCDWQKRKEYGLQEYFAIWGSRFLTPDNL